MINMIEAHYADSKGNVLLTIKNPTIIPRVKEHVKIRNKIYEVLKIVHEPLSNAIYINIAFVNYTSK